MKRRHAALTLVAVALGLLLAHAQTPVMPTAPIVDFRLPVFNEQGFRIWELRGSEAIYDLKAQRAEITGLRLRVFSGDEREAVENTLESPLAIVQIAEGSRTASGPGLIRMVGLESGREFEVRGEDWTFEETTPTPARPEKTKSMVIRRDVVVTFAQDIGNILR